MDVSDKQQKHARFWKKFLRLTRGRVTVLRALEVVAEEERDPEFKKIVDSIRYAIEEGGELSGALRKHAPEFSVSVIELVRAAEKTGAWDEVLAEITEGLEEGTFD